MWNFYRKRTYNLPAGQDQSFTGYTALFGILENERDLLNVESFSISSPTLEDIFLAIIFEADSDPDNIIKKKKWTKEQISPEKNDEDEQSYADLSTDGLSTSSFRISTPRPNIVPLRPSGMRLYANQVTFVSLLTFVFKWHSLQTRFWRCSGRGSLTYEETGSFYYPHW